MGRMPGLSGSAPLQGSQRHARPAGCTGKLERCAAKDLKPDALIPCRRPAGVCRPGPGGAGPRPNVATKYHSWREPLYHKFTRVAHWFLLRYRSIAELMTIRVAPNGPGS